MKMLKVLPVLVVTLCAPPVAAQSNCGPRAYIVEQLQTKYEEYVFFLGLGATGTNITEMFLNSETGTWTVIVTGPSGVSCLTASGQDGQQIPINSKQDDPT